MSASSIDQGENNGVSEAAMRRVLTRARDGKPLELPADLKPDAQRGATLFVSAGCADCHAVPQGALSSLEAPSLAGIKDWTKGCLSPDPAGPPILPARRATREKESAWSNPIRSASSD